MADGLLPVDSSKKKKVENKRYRGKICSAINCRNYANGSPGLSFFRFPKDEER